MGDPLMVALFWVAFLPSAIRWQQLVAEEGAESGQLLAWHPWSGEIMDLSLSQYADDTTKQIVAEPGEDVHALAKKVSCSNDVLIEYWRLLGSRRTEGRRSSKRCFFIGRVVNTAPSGIGAFCPSKAQYQSLTSLVTCLARRLMAGAAARRGEHGRVRTLTNKEVLRFWKLAPCDLETRVRRLKWAQTLVQDPAHHTIHRCHVWETAVRAKHHQRPIRGR